MFNRRRIRIIDSDLPICDDFYLNKNRNELDCNSIHLFKAYWPRKKRHQTLREAALGPDDK